MENDPFVTGLNCDIGCLLLLDFGISQDKFNAHLKKDVVFISESYYFEDVECQLVKKNREKLLYIDHSYMYLSDVKF